MLVINGITNWKYDFWYAMFEYLHTHHLINDQTYESVMSDECDWGMPAQKYVDFEEIRPWQCLSALMKLWNGLMEQNGMCFNLYNIHKGCEKWLLGEQNYSSNSEMTQINDLERTYQKLHKMYSRTKFVKPLLRLFETAEVLG